MANFLTDNGIDGYLEDEMFIVEMTDGRVEIEVEDAVANFSYRGCGTRSWADVDLSEPDSLERLLRHCRNYLCPVY